LESFQIDLEFPSVDTCTEFSTSISKSAEREEFIEQEQFSVALPDSKFNHDSQFYSFLVTFVAHDGLEAVTAFGKLLIFTLEHMWVSRPKHHEDELPMPRYAIVKTPNGDFEVDTNMNPDELRDLLNAKIFHQ
jgi:hypothetical protein